MTTLVNCTIRVVRRIARVDAEICLSWTHGRTFDAWAGLAMPLRVLGGPRDVRVNHASSSVDFSRCVVVRVGVLQVALVVHASSSVLPLVREIVALGGREAKSLALKRADHRLIDDQSAGEPAGRRPVGVIGDDSDNRRVATFDYIARGFVDIAGVAAVKHSRGVNVRKRFGRQTAMERKHSPEIHANLATAG